MRLLARSIRLAKCFTAKDGEDALTKLSEPGQLLPEVIFLDLNMPRMDGRQVLVALKRDERLNKIPVVIYTTSSSASAGILYPIYINPWGVKCANKYRTGNPCGL